jgi:hypothetical protein
MNWTRVKYLAAMMLIGDGALALLCPQRDALTWNAGPESWKNLMSYLCDHPRITRVIGAAEIAAGLALIACDSVVEQLEEDAAPVRISN